MRTLIIAVFTGLCVTAAVAEPLKIIGFETGSGITFEGATVGNYYTLEFAGTAGGPWTNWGSVTDQPITGPVMALPTPFFYRIKQTDSSAFPPYAPASNIPGHMLADGAVTTAKLAPAAVCAANLAPNVSDRFVLKAGDTMTGPLEVRVVTNGLNGIRTAGLNGWTDGWAGIFPSLPSGAWNGIVQPGDCGIIYSRGPVGSGSFVLAPHANAVSGIRIVASGNVGIGTVNPAAKLQVAGDATVDNNLVVGNSIAVSDVGSYPRIELRGASTSYKAINMTDTTSSESWQLSHRTHTPGQNQFHITYYNGTSWNVYQCISTAGNVGVGTPSPADRLSSVGNIRLQGADLRIIGMNSTAPYSLGSSGGAAILFDDLGTGSQEIAFETHHAGVSHAERMRIDKDGNVGIGTATPSAKLAVNGSIVLPEGSAIYSPNNGTLVQGGRLIYRDAATDIVHVGTPDYGNPLYIDPYSSGGGAAVVINPNGGNVGIGTASPTAKLAVNSITAGNTTETLQSWTYNGGQWGLNLNQQHVSGSHIQWNYVDVAGNTLLTFKTGNVGIGTSDPQTRLHVNGNARIDGTQTVKVLSITGGADVAEPFAMSGTELPKGSVVVIDDERVGHLKLSERAYDTRVAGIVSGAGGVNPGITLSQQGVLEGSQNVALSGRVYTLADADSGPIQPGDLLTTSSVPGHAMKATSHADAQGAILGKAMSRLESGRGLVLVLVTLQ